MIQPDTDDETFKEYVVEAILDDREVNGTKKYLLKWKYFSDKENSWEPVSNLVNCELLLKKYHAKKKIPDEPSKENSALMPLAGKCEHCPHCKTKTLKIATNENDNLNNTDWITQSSDDDELVYIKKKFRRKNRRNRIIDSPEKSSESKSSRCITLNCIGNNTHELQTNNTDSLDMNNTLGELGDDEDDEGNNVGSDSSGKMRRNRIIDLPKKKSASKLNKTDSSQCENDATFMNEINVEKVPLKILGANYFHGKLLYFVKWKDMDLADLVPAEEAHQKFLELTYDYHIELFNNSSKNSKHGSR